MPKLKFLVRGASATFLVQADKPNLYQLQTTGVLVFSGGTPVTVKIARNLIFDNSIGIWLSRAVKASGLGTNRFFNVTTRISGNH